MKGSPRHSPRGSISLSHHTESIHIDASEIDEARSPHAIDSRDPNYDPYDDEPAEDVEMYIEESVGTVPHHVVRSTKSTPLKAHRSANARDLDRFGMPTTPSHNQARELPLLSLKKFKSFVDGLLEELWTSSDFAEFVERVTALNCNLYHDELMVHLIRVSLDKEDEQRDLVSELIALMRKSGHVSSGQLSRAFEKLFLGWEDLLLDVPDAVPMILRFVELAIADGCLPDTFLARLPEAFLAKLGSDELCRETYPELVQQLSDLKSFKRKCNALLEDFLASEGAEPAAELAQRLAAAGKPALRHEFIRRAINVALDKEDTERELVSALLSSLRSLGQLTEDDFLWALSHLLGSLPDLSIDCPPAVELVSKFLLRAVTDEVVPPAFLDNAIRLGLGDEQGVEAARRARSALQNTEVEWADLRNVWGRLETGDNAKWRAELDTALREYFDSHDKAEFCRIMREWALCTSRAITVVKHGLLKAMDGDGNDCMAIVDLLDFAVKHEELKSSDVLRAMNELDTGIEDLKLDIPDVAEMLDTFGGLMRNRGLLPMPSPRSSVASFGTK